MRRDFTSWRAIIITVILLVAVPVLLGVFVFSGGDTHSSCDPPVNPASYADYNACLRAEEQSGDR